MSEPYPAELSDAQPLDISLQAPALPAWLARRLLRGGEHITWVRGPRWNPRCERVVTHPGLFVLALLLGGGCLAAGRLIAGAWSDLPVWSALVAGALIIGTIYVLAIACAYFTRLVATNQRLLIVQGREVCRTWGLNDLPRSLVLSYTRGTGEVARTVDVSALQGMLGGPSEGFTDTKTILALGKHLDRIKTRGNDRPG